METTKLVKKTSKKRLWIECILLFILLPTLIDLIPQGKRAIFGVLWIGAFVCYVVLRVDETFDKKCYWNKAAVNWLNLRPILKRFAFGAIFLVGVLCAMDPTRMFEFPLERPQLWIMVMCFYPLLSVYPQEIIYRAFFMHRYSRIFTTKYALMAANALAFGYGHIMFGHWITVALSIAGGYLFASTYLRTKSLGLVFIEHAIYGCWIFTIGLGYYFYSGATQ